jgi:hypothetical protein
MIEGVYLGKNMDYGNIEENKLNPIFPIKTVFYNGANIANSTTTMVAIPALSFNVVPGWYKVKFYPYYNAANIGTGQVLI